MLKSSRKFYLFVCISIMLLYLSRYYTLILIPAAHALKWRFLTEKAIYKINRPVQLFKFNFCFSLTCLPLIHLLYFLHFPNLSIYSMILSLFFLFWRQINFKWILTLLFQPTLLVLKLMLKEKQLKKSEEREREKRTNVWMNKGNKAGQNRGKEKYIDKHTKGGMEIKYLCISCSFSIY